ncbi:type II secretion system minor pseudopilin GspH [Candidatus Albibeggiatoa sp. nov. BB20]|uniref:type II secretion system minor pseudopilin GspH n=1 Tax=Candidatus Albibeggiatoa sp. nov. BB20 TaxID=3162723 RepID=UPI0033659610
MTPNSKTTGFTLLELLIVILIIGVIISFATLSIGDKRQQVLRQEIKQLAALIQFTQQEAIFKNQDLAINFTENSYRFYLLSEDRQWQGLKKTPFRERKLASGLVLELNIEDDPIQLATTETTPQLLMLSSGEISPFSIYLWHETNESQRLVLTGNLLGELEIKTEDEF